jgi:peptide/nickel transport system substrate-binding protein
MVLFAALIAATGCSGRGPRRGAARPADAAPAVSATPAAATLPERASAPDGAPRGGILRVHLEAEPPHLNPLADGHQVIQLVVSGLVYQPLVECGPGGYSPGLAESWQEAPDGGRLLLRLRPGARFHDGHAVTTVDVQASLEPLLRSSSRQPALRALLADVEAVEVLPDRQVRLRLLRPSRLVLRALCEVPILPAELVKGGASALARLPVGTGPFRVAGWEKGKRIRLVPSAPGAARLDEISFEIDGDAAHALSRARRGELDVLPRVLEAHYPDQVDPAALRDVTRLYRLTPERYSFLAVNHRHEPLGDARVRRALALLWNRPRLADEVHRGLARPIGAPPFAAVEALPFDRHEAEKLLVEAGVRAAARPRAWHLTLLAPAGVASAAVEARVFAAELRRVGLPLEVVSLEPAALLARLKQGDFDLAPMLWEGRRDDDPRALFGPHGELAFTGYRAEPLGPLFDELRLAEGPAARAPVLQRIGEALAREQPVIFLYRHDVPALVSRRVHGLAAVGDRLDLRNVWVDP